MIGRPAARAVPEAFRVAEAALVGVVDRVRATLVAIDRLHAGHAAERERVGVADAHRTEGENHALRLDRRVRLDAGGAQRGDDLPFRSGVEGAPRALRRRARRDLEVRDVSTEPVDDDHDRQGDQREREAGRGAEAQAGEREHAEHRRHDLHAGAALKLEREGDVERAQQRRRDHHPAGKAICGAGGFRAGGRRVWHLDLQPELQRAQNRELPGSVKADVVRTERPAPARGENLAPAPSFARPRAVPRARQGRSAGRAIHDSLPANTAA